MDAIFDAVSVLNYNLIPVETDINPPKVKVNLVQIPGRDGFVDFTEALGEVKYESREIKIVCNVKSFSSFQSVYQTFAKYLHGQNRKYKLDSTDNHYFSGRWSVSDVKYETVGEITIKGTCQPYRYKDYLTTVNASISGTANVNCINEMKSVMPTIATDADIDIEFDGKTISLNAGTHQVEDLVLTAGDNVLVITSTAAEVSISYQEAAL